MSKRVAIYSRVSTERQTVANQVSELRAWAERCGHTVVAEYEDHAISGAKGRGKDLPSTACSRVPCAASSTSSPYGPRIGWAFASASDRGVANDPRYPRWSVHPHPGFGYDDACRTRHVWHVGGVR